MITNPKRKNRINEFVDKNHKAMSDFYDLIESEVSEVQAKRALKHFIEEDPDFFDPYLDLAVISSEKVGRELRRRAFERAVSRIADKNGDWPVFMPWGWLENRHLMRALESWAVVLWKEGETEKALDIFRRLFHANPGDNQGARYSVLAIRLGLGIDWDEPFVVGQWPVRPLTRLLATIGLKKT